MCRDGWLLFPSDSKSALSPRPAGGASILTPVLFGTSPKVHLVIGGQHPHLSELNLWHSFQVRGTAAAALASILEHSPIAKMLSLAPVLASAASPAGLTSARASRHSRKRAYVD